MSTRANIVIKDKYDKLWFYRHSDGYPEANMPVLNKLLDWVKDGKIRNNVSQCAGWLIILGALEYCTIPKHTEHSEKFSDYYTAKWTEMQNIEAPADWKCGAYEPTIGQHGDIKYLYTVDLEKKIITYEKLYR